MCIARICSIPHGRIIHPSTACALRSTCPLRSMRERYPCSPNTSESAQHVAAGGPYYVPRRPLHSQPFPHAPSLATPLPSPPPPRGALPLANPFPFRPLEASPLSSTRTHCGPSSGPAASAIMMFHFSVPSRAPHAFWCVESSEPTVCVYTNRSSRSSQKSSLFMVHRTVSGIRPIS